jgi:type II secretory pathway component PulF
MPDGVLAELLGRIAIATSAGIDTRRAWANEATHAPARWRPAIAGVASSLAGGASLADSLATAGDTFPPVVRGMLTAGEQAGCEPDVCRELAAQCRRSAHLARNLRQSLIKPAVQAVVAVGAVSVLILVAGESVDLLGLGLRGVRGVITFLGIVTGTVLAGWLVWHSALRSWQRRGIVRHLVSRLPVIGRAASDAELAAWCRAASLASGIGLDVRRMLTLTSAVAPGLSIDPATAATQLRGGLSLTEMLRETGLFPRRVLEAVGVGELTGTTAETLDRLADDCDEAAARGFAAAASGAGAAVWVGVAAVVVLLIVRLFSAYVGILQGAARGL